MLLQLKNYKAGTSSNPKLIHFTAPLDKYLLHC